MHEIRKNTEVEQDLLKIKFKLPVQVIVVYIVIAIIGALVLLGGNSLLSNSNPAFDLFGLSLIILPVGGLTCVVSILLIIFRIIGFKQSEVTISNKRIYGKYGLYIIKKTFSYRLDEIDNVEVGDFLGVHSLSINFQQGKGPQSAPVTIQYGNTIAPLSGFNVLRLRCVENWQESYDKLNELLLSVKNQIDLETDIAMAKVDAENRKADAFEKMADKMGGGAAVASASDVTNSRNNVSYIEEIKQLKELLESGAITQEEFDQEKKEILDHNHK